MDVNRIGKKDSIDLVITNKIIETYDHKRADFAEAALNGLLSNTNFDVMEDLKVAELAVKLADDLIQALNRK